MLDKLSGGLALASESGVTNSEYVIERSDWIDAAFLGGLAADEETKRAAVRMIGRGREEFIHDDIYEHVRNEMERLDKEDIVPGVNIRSSTVEPLVRIGEIVSEFSGIIEINAHCRQKEMIEAGCGHALMRDADRLSDWVRSVKKTGATVSVKTRAEIVDNSELARSIERAGGDIIHVDCMDSPEAVNEIYRSVDLFIIANNGVRSREDAQDYFNRGADMVSTARGARRKRKLKRIKEGVLRCQRPSQLH